MDLSLVTSTASSSNHTQPTNLAVTVKCRDAILSDSDDETVEDELYYCGQCQTDIDSSSFSYYCQLCVKVYHVQCINGHHFQKIVSKYCSFFCSPSCANIIKLATLQPSAFENHDIDCLRE